MQEGFCYSSQEQSITLQKYTTFSLLLHIINKKQHLAMHIYDGIGSISKKKLLKYWGWDVFGTLCTNNNAACHKSWLEAILQWFMKCPAQENSACTTMSWNI